MNSNDIEDLQLIEQFQKGDKKSFGTLYEKYRDLVFRYFIANGIQAEEASDACQDVFINLLKYLKDTSIKGTFKIFLNQIIRNKLADYYRQKKRKLQIINPAILQSNYEPGDYQTRIKNIDEFILDDDFERKYELAEIVTHCLKRIKNERWRTIILLWVEHYKREQISELLNMPIGSVCSCLSRIRPLFLECIKSHFFENKPL